jgi:hypothetical protein
LLRINGSHHIYGKPGARIRLTIPVHGAAPLKPGLCRHLARQAGIEDLLKASEADARRADAPQQTS